MSRPPRLLVLRGGAIGDFILTLPALNALRERWPDAHIELAGYPHIAALARLGGLADGVSSLDEAGIARLFVPGAALDEPFRDRLRSFDIVLTYLHDPDGVVRENLRAAGVLQVLYGSPVRPAGHAADHLVRPLEDLALYAAGRAPVLPIAADARRAGRERLAALAPPDRAVVLHAGSGSASKNWPVAGFAAVARALRDAGRVAVFTRGEADAALAGALDGAAAAAGARVAGEMELIDLAPLLASAAGYVGNDSGITHLAAAVGLPVVALFGPTDPDVWGPRGPRVRILRAPGGRLEGIAPEAVLDALRGLGAA
jgi:heptosyltransferase-2